MEKKKRETRRAGAKRDGRVRQWVGPFLDALRNSRTVTHACEAVGISRAAAYALRAKDQEFASEWDDVVNRVNDDLEQSALSRAIEGWLEPVFYKGEVCGHVRRFDNSLTIFMLKCRIPEVYSGKDGRGLSPEDYARLYETFEAARNATLRPSENGGR